eukprot:1347989-Amorphochlora_amoeboformis.AAC.1
MEGIIDGMITFMLLIIGIVIGGRIRSRGGDGFGCLTAAHRVRVGSAKAGIASWGTEMAATSATRATLNVHPPALDVGRSIPMLVYIGSPANIKYPILSGNQNYPWDWMTSDVSKLNPPTTYQEIPRPFRNLPIPYPLVRSAFPRSTNAEKIENQGKS